LSVLYEVHSASLWRYVLRLTGDPHQAHDVVQETLLRALRSPEITEDSKRSHGPGYSLSRATSSSTTAAVLGSATK
jgi:hypothetical protein